MFSQCNHHPAQKKKKFRWKLMEMPAQRSGGWEESSPQPKSPHYVARKWPTVPEAPHDLNVRAHAPRLQPPA